MPAALARLRTQRATFAASAPGQVGAMRLLRVREYLFSRLWFVPVVCVAAGVLISVGTLALDRRLGSGFVPSDLTGDPDAALAILTTVAASMVTLTTLVLTVTMVVVQLAMQQFSPRVLRTILRDRPSQAAIGIFVATFAQAMLVMPQVKAASGDQPGYVPGVSIVVSYVLILVCIIVLVSYVNHIGLALRVAALVDSVGDETRELLDKTYPASEPAPRASRPPACEGRPHLVRATSPGVLYRIEAERLAELAAEQDRVCVVVPRIGDFVPQGAALAELYGGGDEVDEAPYREALALGSERTLQQDVAYGLRMLVDVAVKSVSDAFADPTTAVQAIDRLHDCLRQLATRPFPPGEQADEHGIVRVILPTVTWEGYVHLALDELRVIGAGSLQVARRLANLLDDLLDVAPPERRAVLAHEQELLARAVGRAFEDDEDARRALGGDQQGIGSGAATADTRVPAGEHA
jgi:uncharacterized membrane protein